MVNHNTPENHPFPRQTLLSDKGKDFLFELYHNMESNHEPSDNLTSSRTGTFYFAYGSNLSVEQMAGRCRDSATSSMPVAIARLDGWRWIICERGYANVVPASSPGSRSLHVSRPRQEDPASGPGQHPDRQQEMHRPQHQTPPHSSTLPARASEPNAANDDDHVVWGIIYNLTPASESALDGYEGHHPSFNPSPTPNPGHDAARKPFEQGGWAYNKLYLPVSVTRWLQPPPAYGIQLTSTSEAAADSGPEPKLGDGDSIRVLIYVDEIRTGEGSAWEMYTGRMNRAIREGVKLGVPPDWVERVMRRWIQEGVETKKGYLG